MHLCPWPHYNRRINSMMMMMMMMMTMMMMIPFLNSNFIFLLSNPPYRLYSMPSTVLRIDAVIHSETVCQSVSVKNKYTKVTKLPEFLAR